MIDDIDESTDDSTFDPSNGGASGTFTPYIVIIIGVVSILLLIVATLIFFMVSNDGANHQIYITNTSSQNITVVGNQGVTQDTSTPVTIPGLAGGFQLTPGQGVTLNVRGNQRLTFWAVPGLIIWGGISTLANSSNAFTQVILTLGDGTPASIDSYGVSVQNGYNFVASITPTITPNSIINIEDPFSCGSLNWRYPLATTGSGFRSCPENLQTTIETNPVCGSPCTILNGTNYCCTSSNACAEQCQLTWNANISYWDRLHAACPNCMITNCDTLNFYCGSNNAYPTIYNITFSDPGIPVSVDM